MIKFENVSRQFNGKAALDKVSFEIHMGEATAIVGPNGAGKTTLINLLLGFLKPDTGAILFQDLPVWENRHIVNQLYGVVMETPFFFPEFTARQNLRYFSILHKTPLERIDALIGEVGLDKFPDQKFSQYSMGMKQRLAIAKSLLHNPDVLIFDEPTNGLDPVGISDIRNLIQGFTQKGKTVILCSHLLSEVERICDKAVVIKAGKVIEKIDIRQGIGGRHSFQIKSANMFNLLRALETIPEIQVVSSDEARCTVAIEETLDATFISQRLAEKNVFLSEISPVSNFESSVLDKISDK